MIAVAGCWPCIRATRSKPLSPPSETSTSTTSGASRSTAASASPAVEATPTTARPSRSSRAAAAEVNDELSSTIMHRSTIAASRPGRSGALQLPVLVPHRQCIRTDGPQRGEAVPWQPRTGGVASPHLVGFGGCVQPDRWFGVGFAAGREPDAGARAAHEALRGADAKLLVVFCSPSCDLPAVLKGILAEAGGVRLS